MSEAIKLNQPAAIVLIAISAVALVCIVISATGMRPFGEAEMQQQIEREDSALCEKFGMPATTDKFLACRSDLADLRSRHVKMVAFWDLP
jgi:hypothetical protein